MGLFTSLIFNNGVAHTFVEVGQIPDSKSIIRKYIEPAAAQAAQTQILIKQDFSSKTVRRGLCAYRTFAVGSDGIYYPITVNFSTTFNVKHAAADVVLAQKLNTACQADTTFHANFVNGLS